MTPKPVKNSSMNLNLETLTPVLYMPDAASTARDALAKTLQFCAARLNLSSPHAALEQLQQGNPLAFQYARYGLACQIAAAIGTLDPEVKAIYLFDDYATPEDLEFAEAQPNLAINLMVWVERRTKALAVLAQGLNRALIERYAEMFGDSQLEHLLAVQMIDDDDVRRRTGYGALLGSVHHPALEVWKR